MLKACNSLKIGKIFQKYAKHCICIKEDRFVRDDVANMFTKKFYELLCSGFTICSAFDKAVDSIKYKLKQSEEDEALLFQILRCEKTHRE